MTGKETVYKILDEVRLYPSPHNSQPIRIKVVSPDHIELYYDLERGLPAESFGKQFAFVCTGVFLSSLRVVAGNYGYSVKEKLALTDMDFSSDDSFHYLGVLELEKTHTKKDSPTPEYRAFKKRQTSRIPYDNQPVDNEALEEAESIARHYNQRLNVLSDQELVKQIIDINQRTLFSDMENDAVYAELMQWLRFSEKEAKASGDGLSAKTMLIPGPVLKFVMHHRGLWNAPIIGKIIQSIYLNTMKGVRQVAWITGKFDTLEDYVEAGKCFMDIWLCLTKYDIYLHPYGTVITNRESHARFTSLVNEQEDGGTMTWMLFRLGYSKQPPKSYRRPLKEMLITPEVDR